MSTPDRETLSVDVENLEDALTRVQWVRNGTGTGYHCHFCGGVSIQDGGDDHADDCEWVRLTRGDVSRKVAEQAERIATLTAQVEQLHEALGQASSVCACGCPTSEHENYGEDGESCGVDGHSCYRTSLAALFEMRAFRTQVEQQAQELATTNALLDERQRVLDAIPPCLAHGPCVPQALEWIEAAKQQAHEIARLREQRNRLQTELLAAQTRSWRHRLGVANGLQ